MKTSKPTWSDLIHAHGIDDMQKGAAYDMASAQERACLKNAIAFHALPPVANMACAAHTEYTRKDIQRGYWQKIMRAPVPWVLVVCSCAYVSAARFIAACMPAFMAQVPRMAFVSVDGSVCQSILVAMELMGLEESVALPCMEGTKNLEPVPNITLAQQCIYAMTMLEGSSSEGQNVAAKGRVLFLHKGETYMDALKNFCQHQHIPYFEDITCPRIAAHLEPDALQLLHFAQPDAHYLESTENTVDTMENAVLDAFYGEDTKCVSSMIPSLPVQDVPVAMQYWAPGMEGCFVHAQLQTNFFQNTLTMAGPILSVSLAEE